MSKESEREEIREETHELEDNEQEELDEEDEKEELDEGVEQFSKILTANNKGASSLYLLYLR